MEANEKNFRIKLLRQGSLILGMAFLIGAITASRLVPVSGYLLTFGICTGIFYLCINLLLKIYPNSFSLCSWMFCIALLTNSSFLALNQLGFSAPVLGLVSISPVIAALLLGSRGGIAIYIGGLICLVTIFVIDFNQFLTFPVAPRFELYKAKMVVMTLLLTATLLISLAYEKSRKENENRLKEALHQKEMSELHLNQTNKIANIGGWSLDPNSQDLWWSEQTYRIHELPIGTKIKVAEALNYYAEEARPIITAAVKKGMESGEGWDLELPFITAKQKRIWVRAVGVCHANPDGSKILRGTFQDITEKRENDEKLRDAHTKALQASASKSLFLANMSHEIRTPMNGVLGNAGLLLEDNLTSSQKKIAANIVKSGESMMQILNDILDFSKIDAGQVSLYPHTFNLREQFSSIHQLFEMQAAEKGIDFRLELDKKIPENVYADSTRLRQIVSNLVSNAIKFTKKGWVALRIKLVGSNEKEATIRIEVEDTGIGISENNQKNLFIEFSQADQSTTKEFGGTGLGLSISQRLAKMLDGTIEVVSEPEKGSLFWLEFKLQIATITQMQTKDDKAADEKENLGKLKVLLVEDNAINLELASNYLSRFGIEYEAAINGKEAVEKLKNQTYDIVLMDCQMPIMDGYEATRTIRNFKLSTQPIIIAMTANAMSGDEEKCRAAGMDDYLSKPISRSKLKTILTKWHRVIAQIKNHDVAS